MHGRRSIAVAVSVASLGAALWMLRAHAERLLLPLLPLHGECLDTLGGWADLARGELPATDCPPAKGSCELALLLADDATLALPIRMVARAHAIAAHCPATVLSTADLTLPPAARRTAGTDDPWGSELLALQGLWADAVMQRAVLGDTDALDLAADLVVLDPGLGPVALAALGPELTATTGLGALSHALYEAAGAPERSANAQPALAGLLPEAKDVLDAVTGTGDATHALLAEAEAVAGFVRASADEAQADEARADEARATGALDRLEAALFTPTQQGGPPADVHYALVSGGGSPGATALAAELVWGPVSAQWVPVSPARSAGIRLGAGGREWWLDGCSVPRRVRAEDPTGVPVAPVHLALAERVGALLRAGDPIGAQAVEALLRGMLPGSSVPQDWAPRLFVEPAPPASQISVPAPAQTPPWVRPEVRKGAVAVATVDASAAPDAFAQNRSADAFAQARSADALALAAWASWRAQDEDLARRLLRTPPPTPWARYAWRVTAKALGEPSDPPRRPEGCAPPLWPGPL